MGTQKLTKGQIQSLLKTDFISSGLYLVITITVIINELKIWKQ